VDPHLAVAIHLLLQIASDVLSGLAYLHSRNIVHRGRPGVKPSKGIAAVTLIVCHAFLIGHSPLMCVYDLPILCQPSSCPPVLAIKSDRVQQQIVHYPADPLRSLLSFAVCAQT
jgi:hypothetical protein